MARGWTVSMGPSGGVLLDYRGYADIRFVDPLYDYGAAQVILTGLDGHAAPVSGWVIKLVYDKGLASQQVHWQGVISAAEKRQQGSVYVLQAYTVDGLLNVNQAGGIRNYTAKTPHTIAQAAGTPNPLLRNAQGNLVMAYGAAAGVPNKVNAGSPGYMSGTLANDQYVAHSKSLLDNVKRLCWQSRYNPGGVADGSYGLEWTTTLEGGNSSTPTFYLVKRRERSAAYTPEVFVIPTTMHRAKRGNPTFSGVDTVLVVGGGDGTSRIVSAVAGAGSREIVLDDKAIYVAPNADNYAQRALQVYGVTTEAITGIVSRHESPTRAGDTVTIQQSGYADLDLRVMARFYDTKSRFFTYQLGRLQPKTRELLQGQLGFTAAVGTAPQFTDTQPESLQSGVQYYIDDRGGNIVVGAGATGNILDSSLDVIFGGSSFADLGRCESLLGQLVLDVVAATVAGSGGHSLVYDKANSPTGATDAAGGGATAEPHVHAIGYTSTAVGGAVAAPTIAGPFQVEASLYFNSGQRVVIMQRVIPHLVAGERYFDMCPYNFAVEDPGGASGDFSPTQLVVTFRNDGPFAITLRGTGNRATSTEFGIWRKPLHRHNTL